MSFKAWGIGVLIVAVVLALPLAFLNRRPIYPFRTRWWEKLLYLALLACAAGLGITGLATAGFYDRAMTGFYLAAHVALGGAFVSVLALLALAWAERNRLGEAGLGPALLRVLFWWLMAGGLAVGLTALLAMLQAFGTDGQHLLYELHRWTAVVWLGGALMHAAVLAASHARRT